MIADLVRRRDDVLADTEELSAKLTRAVVGPSPAAGISRRVPDSPKIWIRCAREGSERSRRTGERDQRLVEAEARREPRPCAESDARSGPETLRRS